MVVAQEWTPEGHYTAMAVSESGRPAAIVSCCWKSYFLNYTNAV